MGGRSGQTIVSRNTTNKQASALDNYKKAFDGEDNYRNVTTRKITEQNVLEKTIEIYTLRGYKVNYKIRDNDLNDADKAYIQNLDMALDSLPKDQQQNLYRATRLNDSDIRKLAKGVELTFTGYTSTTKSRNVALDILEKHIKAQDKSPVLFEVISHKTGKSVQDISIFPEEKETLFKRNSKWKIDDIVLENKGGKQYYKIKIKEK